MEDLLNNTDIIIPVVDGEVLAPRTVIRRVSPGKDQQGCFMEVDADGGIVLTNVVDNIEGIYVTDMGVIHPEKGDVIYKYLTGFGNSPVSIEALDIVKEWALFRNYPDLQNAILSFVIGSFVPEQVMDYSQSGAMAHVFIPIQQRFKIGKYTEKIDWEAVRKDKFEQRLAAIGEGDTITYLALLDTEKGGPALFYSLGSKSHEESDQSLKSEAFHFIPSHAGHIRMTGMKAGRKQCIVDAGSCYKGSGTRTPLNRAKEITNALNTEFPGYDFQPVEGRGAFGSNTQ